MAFQIIRKDDSQRLVFGWASVSVTDGQLVEDLQGDMIAPEELEEAVYDFMQNYRAGTADGSGVMHDTPPVAEVVASLVTSPDIVAAFKLGTDIPVGWILGLRVLDDAVWARVKGGELQALSIQGTAERQAA